MEEKTNLGETLQQRKPILVKQKEEVEELKVKGFDPNFGKEGTFQLVDKWNQICDLNKLEEVSFPFLQTQSSF